MIRVVNKYHHTPTNNDFYIGRGSPLGNPFTSIKNRKTKAQFICNNREESVERYKAYLLNKIKIKDKLICDELNKIYLTAKENKIVYLVCFCKPKLCHGDVIKNLIEDKIK